MLQVDNFMYAQVGKKAPQKRPKTPESKMFVGVSPEVMKSLEAKAKFLKDSVASEKTVEVVKEITKKAAIRAY